LACRFLKRSPSWLPVPSCHVSFPVMFSPKLKQWPVEIAFVALYVFLDWASYLSPYEGLNLTPWNPAPALGIVHVIRYGWRGAIPLFVGIAASDIVVRSMPGNWGATLLLSGVLSAGYACLAWMLKRHSPDGRFFAKPADFFRWSIWVVIGSLIIGTAYVSALVAVGLLPLDRWLTGLIRYWVGDSVGIFIAMPLFWCLSDAARRAQFVQRLANWETAVYSLVMLAVLWIVFMVDTTTSYRYFYILFLPLVWAASRQGLIGAVFSVSILQAGLAVAGFHQYLADISLFELQLRAFVIALVGFIIGVAIDEQQRSAAELRQTARLVVAGEMAGALAHEVNQPLTALSAYAAACERLIGHPEKTTQLGEVLQRLSNEVQRLSNVIRRLRDFFRTGATVLEPVPLRDLMRDVCAPFQDQARQSGIGFHIDPLPDVELLLDRLQVEIVFRNLLMNAFEAVTELSRAHQPAHAPEIRILSRLSVKKLTIDVVDNGPGVPEDSLEQVFEPFASTKSSGLGLGLAISRAIAEAHGGSLAIFSRHAPGGRGVCFRLELPLDAGEGGIRE